jgi:hypothetical protein
MFTAAQIGAWRFSPPEPADIVRVRLKFQVHHPNHRAILNPPVATMAIYQLELTVREDKVSKREQKSRSLSHSLSHRLDE